jgi:hypothetical protein
MSVLGEDYGKEVLGFQGDPNFYEPYEPVAPPSIDPRYILNPDEGGANDPVGNTSDNYITPFPYTGTGLTNTMGDISNVLRSLFGDGKGGLDILKLGALGGGLASLFGANSSSSTPTGYQGGIPRYTATRNMVTAPEAGRRPGAGGTRYGGDVSFMPKVAAQAPVTPAAPEEVKAAQGGLMGLAQGRYLQGGTDGMADEIPAQIGEDQPAALSHGEFVIPADVVSHLGNGNSDAGAQRLYDMMDKIREARTGTKEQGKEINPDSFMPGGLAKAYAAGGEVQRFQTGGISGVGTAANAGVTGTESNLSNWAGPYVTDMLGKGQALSEMPYQEYGGPLTAGASNLQNKVFSGLSNVNFPGQLGQSFSSAGAPTIGAGGQPVGGGTSPASQYMNPYLQSVLQPQLAEMRRQAEITNQSGLGALTKAGAFGGGRQAIMESEAGRNLLQEQNKTIGQGYSNAYDKAMQQFNTEQGQGMGLANLMAGQGGIERGIESEGIAADKTAFEEARANPYKMVQFQQSLLSGLPLAAQSINTAQPSAFANALTGAGSVASLLKNLGLGPTPATPAPKP